jgi:hypothetical protein
VLVELVTGERGREGEGEAEGKGRGEGEGEGEGRGMGAERERERKGSGSEGRVWHYPLSFLLPVYVLVIAGDGFRAGGER